MCPGGSNTGRLLADISGDEIASSGAFFSTAAAYLDLLEPEPASVRLWSGFDDCDEVSCCIGLWADDTARERLGEAPAPASLGE